MFQKKFSTSICLKFDKKHKQNKENLKKMKQNAAMIVTLEEFRLHNNTKFIDNKQTNVETCADTVHSFQFGDVRCCHILILLDFAHSIISTG